MEQGLHPVPVRLSCVVMCTTHQNTYVTMIVMIYNIEKLAKALIIKTERMLMKQTVIVRKMPVRKTMPSTKWSLHSAFKQSTHNSFNSLHMRLK